MDIRIPNTASISCSELGEITICEEDFLLTLGVGEIKEITFDTKQDLVWFKVQDVNLVGPYKFKDTVQGYLESFLCDFRIVDQTNSSLEFPF